MPQLGKRHIAEQRREQILACASDHILNNRFHALYSVARQVGISQPGLRHYAPTVDDLVRQLCLRHLDKAFDAVCLPTDWQGTAIEVLRAMGLALLAHIDENGSRHLVFMLHRRNLDDPARSALDTLLTYLTNNFQLALQGVKPDDPFDILLSPARMFLGQMFHLPLWWPEEPHICKDSWLCDQIGQLTGMAAPDWRMPPVRREGGQGLCPWTGDC
jgi:AcrR family transcriptional regulator